MATGFVLQTQLKSNPDWGWADRKKFDDKGKALRERDAYRRLATSLFNYRVADVETGEEIN
jgi:hypothetical protein